jgi:plasmid stabilization system protein ParE
LTRSPLRVVVTARAAQQIEEAAGWWHENRPAAPDAIRDELIAAFRFIALSPSSGARAHNVRLPGVRRVLLARVSYFLYYRVNRASRSVEVLAFWHARRASTPPMHE